MSERITRKTDPKHRLHHDWLFAYDVTTGQPIYRCGKCQRFYAGVVTGDQPDCPDCGPTETQSTEPVRRCRECSHYGEGRYPDIKITCKAGRTERPTGPCPDFEE